MRAELLRFGRRSRRCDASRRFTRSPTCGSTDSQSRIRTGTSASRRCSRFRITRRTTWSRRPVDFAARYDRVPKSEVEIRRASAVESANGHHLGDVDGFLVDDDQLITHVVLEQGYSWERREVLIPIGAVSRVESDEVTLSLTRERPQRPNQVVRGRNAADCSLEPETLGSFVDLFPLRAFCEHAAESGPSISLAQHLVAGTVGV
jgi:hypothetical protein